MERSNVSDNFVLLLNGLMLSYCPFLICIHYHVSTYEILVEKFFGYKIATLLCSVLGLVPLPIDYIQILIFGVCPRLNCNFSNMCVLSIVHVWMS